MKNWEAIKEEIYYEDGSLRDIYICDTDKDDWKAWSNLVNEKFDVEFYNGRTGKTEDRINRVELLRYWIDPSDFTDVNRASIKLGNVVVNCYLYFESEMENDIDPREVKTEEDHQAIMEYLHAVAGTLKKKVIITSEMTKEDILLEV